MAIDSLGSSSVQKPRWGDIEEEEDNGSDYDFLLLPPKQVIGPDEHGLKLVIEFKYNDDHELVKTTTKIRVTKLANARISKRAVERRSWPKFGDAVDEDVGARLTIVSNDDIYLERPRAPGTKAEESNASVDPLAQTSKGGALLICRTCNKKGDHWTKDCPYKDLSRPSVTFDENPNPNTSDAGPSSTKRGAYVPPTMRPGAARPAGADMRRRNDENSIRVNNLSEDACEADLLELFQPFGSVSRVYVSKDKNTGMSRGFGFVNFVKREDGERAIATLNGHGYGNLILSVEWAAPRAN